jgi:release factor glutamine methyltransferase
MSSDLLFAELSGRLAAAWQGLPDKPDERPASTLRALWLFVGGPAGPAGALPALDEGAVAQLEALVARRLTGEPLSYLVGRQVFMGMELLASPAAMIPRQETEILGRAALGLLQALAQERGLTTVIDLCTGSGNVALALAWYVPSGRVWGGDLSEEAVQLARQNAQHLGLADRVQFRAGDFLTPFETEALAGRVDLVTCNPPYISTARAEKLPHEIAGFEPRLAFDGGPFGIRLLTRLVKEAPRFLKPGGWVVCEVGLGQGEAMARAFQKASVYRKVQMFADERGEVRVLAAQI